MPKGHYRVRLTQGAENDLEGIVSYVAQHRSTAEAAALLDAILHKVSALESFPEPGSVPRELAELGIDTFRQLLLPPYRLVYRVGGRTVFVMVIADGRRDMASLLQARLLAR